MIFSFFWFFIGITLILSGCGNTSVIKDKDGITLSVYGGNGVVMDDFIMKFTESNPDIHISYEPYLGTAEEEVDEFIRKKTHKDLPDIIICTSAIMNSGRPIDVKDNFVDLSGYPFVSAYTLPVLEAVQKEGNIYFLPSPTFLRGIAYNKTMFKEYGWEVPKSFDEFIELCKTIESQGIRSMQWPFYASAARYNSLLYLAAADFLTLPAGGKWSESFKVGKADMTGVWEPIMDSYQRLIDAGIYKEEDLEVRGGQRSDMMATRGCAMEEENTMVQKYMNGRNSKDEYGMMPFFGTKENSDWVVSEISYILGINKELEEIGQNKRLEAAERFLEFYSSDEGQKCLIYSSTGLISNVKGIKVPEDEFFDDIRETVNKNHIMNIPRYTTVTETISEQVALLLQGKTTHKEFLAACDKANKEGAKTTIEEGKFLGTSSKDFTREETAEMVMEALRDISDANIALQMERTSQNGLDGNNIRGCIYEGDITEKDIQLIMPYNISETEDRYMVGEIKGVDLEKYIREGAAMTPPTTYFAAGMKLEYEKREDGNIELVSMKDKKGKNLDLEKTYKIAYVRAVSENGSFEAAISNKQMKGKTLQQVVCDYIIQKNQL